MKTSSAVNENFATAAPKPLIDTVVIPVAGKGTRLLPRTKVIPKHFQTVGDISLIQYAVDEAKKAGARKFVFIIDNDPLSRTLLEKHFLPREELEHHLREKGKLDKLDELKKTELDPAQISFVVQTEQTGLWDAVKQARSEIIGDTFAVITPDDLILPSQTGLPDLARHHRKGGISVSVEHVPLEDASKFGIVKYTSQKDGVYKVSGVVEKPAPGQEPSDMAIAGRYILPVSLFDKYQPAVDPSVKEEISIAHAINAVAKEMPVGAVVVAGTKFDGGSRLGLALANMHVFAEDAEIGPALRQRNAHIPGQKFNFA